MNYDFKCHTCGQVFELSLDVPQEIVRHVHDINPIQRALCESEDVKRIYVAPSSNTYTSLAKPRIDKSMWPEHF